MTCRTNARKPAGKTKYNTNNKKRVNMKKHYIVPEICLTEFRAENGFALSNRNTSVDILVDEEDNEFI